MAKKPTPRKRRKPAAKLGPPIQNVDDLIESLRGMLKECGSWDCNVQCRPVEVFPGHPEYDANVFDGCRQFVSGPETTVTFIVRRKSPPAVKAGKARFGNFKMPPGDPLQKTWAPHKGNKSWSGTLTGKLKKGC